jgi:hypothetical protein
VHSAEPDQMSVIRFYGREVLPRVRHRLAQTERTTAR